MIARLAWEPCSLSEGIIHAEQTWTVIQVFKPGAWLPRDAAHKRHSARLCLQTRAQCTKSLDSYSTRTGNAAAHVFKSQKLMHGSKWTIKRCIMVWKGLCVHQGNSDCDGAGEVDFKQLPHMIVGSGKLKFCRAYWKAKDLGWLLLQV